MPLDGSIAAGAVQFEAGLAGLVRVIAFPLKSAATHSAGAHPIAPMMLVPSMFWSFQAAGPPAGLLDLTALPLSSPTTQKWGVVQATLRRLRWLMSLLPEPSTSVRPNHLIGPAASAAGAAVARSASEKRHAMRRRRIGPTYPATLARVNRSL